MNFKLLAIIGLLATVSVVAPIKAQNTESVKSGTPTAQAQGRQDS